MAGISLILSVFESDVGSCFMVANRDVCFRV